MSPTYYQRRVQPVLAVQLREETELADPRGLNPTVPVHPGDWVVTEPDGTVLVYSPEFFARRFEPVPTPAAPDAQAVTVDEVIPAPAKPKRKYGKRTRTK